MRKCLQLFVVLLLAGAIVVDAQTTGKAQSLGTLANGVYHHTVTGIEFTLIPDWVIVSQQPSSAGAQVVLVRDTVSNIIAAAWLKARTANSADIPALMDRYLENKVGIRSRLDQSAKGAHARPYTAHGLAGSLGGALGTELFLREFLHRLVATKSR